MPTGDLYVILRNLFEPFEIVKIGFRRLRVGISVFVGQRDSYLVLSRPCRGGIHGPQSNIWIYYGQFVFFYLIARFFSIAKYIVCRVHIRMVDISEELRV